MSVGRGCNLDTNQQATTNMNQPTVGHAPSLNDRSADYAPTRLTFAIAWLLGSLAAAVLSAAQPAVPAPAKPVPGAQKPVAKTAEKPVEKPADKPAEKPAVVPAVPPKAKAGEKQKEEPKDEAPPKPEVNWLDTKDGWRIHCMYYGPKPGIRKGKDTVPIILLHGWQGKGSEYDFLATGLQTYGHAIAVPDLRGHGRSITRRKPDGDFETIKHEDTKKFGPADLKAMVQDVEAVKKLLVEKNNEGELNIDMLCVVGAEFGCALAINWAALDWSWPPTTAGKQGQDVKALVLLSPSQQNPRGYQCTTALNSDWIKKQLSIVIAVGSKDRTAYSAAKRIYSNMETARPKLIPEERERKQSLFFIEPETELQGTKLLDRNLPVNRVIVGFIERRILWYAPDYPWAERRSPLSGK
jgi:pimeloyl-ACP methyl ester carboxylesterase